MSRRSNWVEFKPSNDSINHNLFVFQTFTFLLAWHFPHRYICCIGIGNNMMSSAIWCQ